MRASLFLIFVALGTCASAQDLGTLFHTPEERKALDRMRRGEPNEPPIAPEIAAVPDPAITGYVKRSDGKSTVFLDKRPYPARDSRIQGLLEPRVIERYEPRPLHLQPAPSEGGEDGKAAKEPAAPQGNAATRPKNGKAD